MEWILVVSSLSMENYSCVCYHDKDFVDKPYEVDVGYKLMVMTPVVEFDTFGIPLKKTVVLEQIKNRHGYVAQPIFRWPIDKIPKETFEKWCLWTVLTPVEIVEWKKCQS